MVSGQDVKRERNSSRRSSKECSKAKRDKVVSSFWFFLSIGPRTIKRGSKSLFCSLAQIIFLFHPIHLASFIHFIFATNIFCLLFPSCSLHHSRKIWKWCCLCMPGHTGIQAGMTSHTQKIQPIWPGSQPIIPAIHSSAEFNSPGRIFGRYNRPYT
jgi:hypothetical protein